MRICHLLCGEVLSPVVRSQTFPLLTRLRARGHEVSLVVFTSPRRLLDRGRYAEVLAEARECAGGDLHVLTHPPRHRVPRLSAWRLRGRLRRLAPDVLHCRQSRGAVVGLRARQAPVVADLRGVRPEEYLLGLGAREAELSRKERWTLRALREQDREAVGGAASIVCVSEAFRRHLGRRERVFVIPNAVDAQGEASPASRAEVRRRYGLGEGALTCVYAGSLAGWQCPREAVRLFAGIRRLVPEARLVLLTHDPGEGRRLIEESGVSGALVDSLSPPETRRTLPAFDLAFLLRRRNLVNEVACPVKFGEYLAAGLPVVVTEGIGDVSGWVREHGLGIVLPDPDDPENPARVVGALSGADGSRCRRFARERLDFEVTARLYEEAFRAAAPAGPAGGALR